MKATAIAPSNIAFIKYWGRKNEVLRLPENGSLSMNLSSMTATSTVEFSPRYIHDEIAIIGYPFDSTLKERFITHLDRIRGLMKERMYAKVVISNNFPIGTGLSASAAIFAALTVAATHAAGLHLTVKDLSIIARQGSGSACRSIPDGFVEWYDGDISDASYAVTLFPPKYWEIVDVVAVVNEGRKDVSSSVGQKLVQTSPFFKVRQAHISRKLQVAKKYLLEKNFPKFGELVEAEALEMHAVMLTSNPSLIYWTTGTLTVMRWVKRWRSKGLPVYFTINTGQDVHLLCEAINEAKLVELVRQLPEVKQVIVNKPANGARVTHEHLF